jgi:hypothetical protein
VELCGEEVAAGASGDSSDTLPLPAWLGDLVTAGKLLEMHDFNKFLWGCAGMLPDMVRSCTLAWGSAGNIHCAKWLLHYALEGSFVVCNDAHRMKALVQRAQVALERLRLGRCTRP